MTLLSSKAPMRAAFVILAMAALSACAGLSGIGKLVQYIVKAGDHVEIRHVTNISRLLPSRRGHGDRSGRQEFDRILSQYDQRLYQVVYFKEGKSVGATGALKCYSAEQLGALNAEASTSGATDVAVQVAGKVPGFWGGVSCYIPNEPKLKEKAQELTAKMSELLPPYEATPSPAPQHGG